MKKILSIVLFLAIVTVLSFAMQIRRGAGAVDDFFDYFFYEYERPQDCDLEELVKFYGPIIEKMKIRWVKEKPDKETREAGWVTTYMVKNEDIYISISKGFTEDEKQKMAFNAGFKEKQIFCHCYFENGVPELHSPEDSFDCGVFFWLLEKGFFRALPLSED